MTDRTADRHPEADRAMVAIEVSDALDAAAGLVLLAQHARREAARRGNAGPRMAPYRAGQRAAAQVYLAAAIRVQAACDHRHDRIDTADDQTIAAACLPRDAGD